MSTRRTIAAPDAALLSTAPWAAFAQSAGDERYEDPFAGGEPTTQPPPAPAPTLESDPVPGPEPAAERSATGAAELPETGVETALVAMCGAGLLLTGTGVRLRLRAGA